jgi:hypothetical protein
MRKDWKVCIIPVVIIALMLFFATYYASGLPTEETAESSFSFQQDTRCDYKAYLKPNTLYGEVVSEGQTIYMDLAKTIEVDFNCTFECILQGAIDIDYKVKVILQEPSQVGWKKSIDGMIPTEFNQVESTSMAKLNARLTYNVSEISELIGEIEGEVGYSSNQYQVLTMIELNTTYETDLEKIVKPTVQEITIAFTYFGMGGIIEVSAPETHILGSIVDQTTTEITSNVLYRNVSLLGLLAWIAIGATLIVLLYRRTASKQENLPTVQRIMQDYDTIESKNAPQMPKQILNSINDLSKLANDYFLRIFHTRIAEKDVFFVVDSGTVYQFIVDGEGEEAPKDN